MAKRTLVIFRHSPYGNSLSRSGLDAVLAAGAFEQDVSVLFMADAVLQWLPNQDSSGLGRRNQAKVLASLAMYDIESVWVEAEALTARAVDSAALPPGIALADQTKLRQLMTDHDHVLVF